jgi:hypothetical protein
MKNLRVKLIETILEHATDEFPERNDIIDLAKMTEEKLIYELINILEYYANQVN